MMTPIDAAAWLADSGWPGPAIALSFGIHGDERPPIDAGLRLVAMLESHELRLRRGKLLLLHGNPLATEQGRRFSADGVDLNRCFGAPGRTEAPDRDDAFEVRRASEIVAALENQEIETLVDFHCTVEPGEPFLMHHPAVDHAPSRTVSRLLSARVLLTDPALNFGGVSLDEWMATRGRVGICYETGWSGDPTCTAEFVLDEMLNVLTGLSMLDGRDAAIHDDKILLQLECVITCEAEGFRWHEGIGTNLQALRAGTELGRYRDGTAAILPCDATLIFPKRRAELLQPGRPLVYLGVRR